MVGKNCRLYVPRRSEKKKEETVGFLKPKYHYRGNLPQCSDESGVIEEVNRDSRKKLKNLIFNDNLLKRVAATTGVHGEEKEQYK